MIVVAVASGTSVDGCDVAAVDVDWDGDVVAMRLLGTTETALPAGLADRVLATLPPAQPGMEEVCRLDTDLGRAFAEAAATGVRELAGGTADLVVSPGQTVFHDVSGDRCLGTLQLGQPAWVAERTGLPVVSDLRASDVAAGGHGAPLASTFDALWLAGAHPQARTAALNLGGIANASVVDPRAGLLASFDTGPANCLIDVAAADVSGGELAYDVGGRLAEYGTVDDALLAGLLDHPYFDLRPPKSTGRELFSAAYLARARAGLAVDGPNLLATVTELTARTVADALRGYDPRGLYVSGGGARNPALVRALERNTGMQVARTEDHGIDPAAKESLLWALLGFLTWFGVPGTVPAAGRVSTGASAPRVLGRVTPGQEPLRMPEPRATGPRALALR